MSDITTETAAEQIEREAAEEAAHQLLLERRARRALNNAPEIATHVRSLATASTPERGETLPEWSAPMRITAADDLDQMYARLIEWVAYWAETLELNPNATSMVAIWENTRGPLGFRAGTTSSGAGILVKLVAVWLLNRHELIAALPQAAEAYFEDVAQLVRAVDAKYPAKEPRPRDVSPRPCTVCGEPAVGAEWSSAEVRDVVISCEHCGEVFPTTVSQILKWLSVDEPTETVSAECLIGDHDYCRSVHCECAHHTRRTQ